MSTQAIWSIEQVTALGVTTDIATAAQILGISRSTAYALAAHGTFPVPLIHAGHRKIVPVSALLRILQPDPPRRLERPADRSVHGTPPPADSPHDDQREHH